MGVARNQRRLGFNIAANTYVADVDCPAMSFFASALGIPQQELLKPKSPEQRHSLSTKLPAGNTHPSVTAVGTKPRPTVSSSSNMPSLRSSPISGPAPRSNVRTAVARPASQTSPAVPMRRPASQMSLPAPNRRDVVRTPAPAEPSTQRRTGASVATSSISVRQRVASYTASPTARETPSVETSTQRTSSRLARPVSRDQIAQTAERNANARTRPSPGALNHGSLPSRLRPTSVTPTSSVGSTVASRQRSALPLNKVSATTAALTSRTASMRSLRQEHEPGPAAQARKTPGATSAQAALPVAGQNSNTSTNGAVRNSASSASLRTRPLHTLTGSAPVERSASKVGLASQKPAVNASSSARIAVASTDKRNRTPSVNIARATLPSHSKGVSRNTAMSQDSALTATSVPALVARNDVSAPSPKSKTPVTSKTSDSIVAVEAAGASVVPSFREGAHENEGPMKLTPPATTAETSPAGQTPPRTLRPLRLVEKRHSVNLGQSQTSVTHKLSANTSPHMDDSVEEQDKAESPLSPSALVPELGPAPSKDATNVPTHTSSPIGLGLGLPLYPSSTRLRDTSIASPVVGSDFSTKYHPASAFDPPSRLPSISITGSRQEDEDADDCIPHDRTKGVSLTIGIPCVINVTPSSSADSAVSTPVHSRTRLKAACRYIGQVHGKSGEWIGVEINLATLRRAKGDLIQDPEEPLQSNGQHDGSWNGVRYYKIDNSSMASSINSPRSFSRPISPLTMGYRTSRELSKGQPFLASRMPCPPSTLFDADTFSSRARMNGATNMRRVSATPDCVWDGAMSFMSNPETTWRPGADDAASNRKCGLWIKPSDVVLVPGAHE